jgi:hypothetical protein
MIKPLAVALSGVGGMGRDGGDNLANVQCKAVVNWHNESPLYNECMLKNNKEIIFIISH